MQLIFATCAQQRLVTPDDQVLADALRARGVDVAPVPWTELDPFAVVDAPPILLRSTWDYHRMPTMFAAWLRALDDSGRRVWNPPALARANINKAYLRELEAEGIAIPRTRWLDELDHESLVRALDEEGWDRAVLKPRVAATAYGTHVIDRTTRLSADDLGPARASGALLQRMIPEVMARGEMSFVFIAGAFSHAVMKTASPGEFRVQKDFGGTVRVITPAREMLAFAERVMRQTPPESLYARVDMVDTATGPLLMELELIEPELYFLHVPAAAARFADAIVTAIAS